MGKVNPIGESTGAKTQNAGWLANDIVPTKDSKIRMTVCLDTTVKIEVTLDGGTKFVSLNENNSLVADSLFMFDIGVRVGDKFNIRTPTVGGATIVICRLDEVSGEG